METNEMELLPQFIRIGELMHRYRHWAHQMCGPGADPHRGQGRVMALLKMRPEISQKDLSYLLDIRPQSLGELLAKLERGGYIEREPSPEDRRVMNIKLTEAGASAAEQRTMAADATMFSSLTGDERTTLGGLLAKVVAELEQSLEKMHEEHGCEEHGRHRHHPPHERRHLHSHEHEHDEHGHGCGHGRPHDRAEGFEMGRGREGRHGGRGRCGMDDDRRSFEPR